MIGRKTPLQTAWTFLIQVLHPDRPCRAAVAEVLAEHTAMRYQLLLSWMACDRVPHRFHRLVPHALKSPVS